MARPVIALATEARFAEGVPPEDSLAPNVHLEDRILIAALEQEGLGARRVDWSSPNVDWSAFDAVLIRTPWDYFERMDAFRDWLHRAASATALFNPRDLVLWNLHKGYLEQLAKTGVPVVEFELLRKSDAPLELAARLDEHGWDQAVIKPAVSAGAWETHRLSALNAAELEQRLAPVAAGVDLIIQPFVESIATRGEVSLMVIDGTVTHAVLKKAAAGDFRVQDDHGGTVHDHEPSEAERRIARQAIEALGGEAPLYARVDMVADPTGAPRVMELELIEPELWMRFDPGAADCLARGLRRRIL